MPLTGRWRIVEMDLWDRDAIDLIEPGFIDSLGTGPVSSASSPSVAGWTAAGPNATGAPLSSSAGTAWTRVIRSAGAAGPPWLMTQRSRDTCSSTWGTTRVSGRSLGLVPISGMGDERVPVLRVPGRATASSTLWESHPDTAARSVRANQPSPWAHYGLQTQRPDRHPTSQKRPTACCVRIFPKAAASASTPRPTLGRPRTQRSTAQTARVLQTDRTDLTAAVAMIDRIRRSPTGAQLAPKTLTSCRYYS
jgi:hypothetical protein